MKQKNLQEGEQESSTTWTPGGFELSAKSTKHTSSEQSRYNQNQMVRSPTDHMWNSCMIFGEYILISRCLELTAVPQDSC